MITEDLITFIQSQRKKNKTQSEISSRLAKVGWHIDDIEEGFRKVAQIENSLPQLIQEDVIVGEPQESLMISPSEAEQEEETELAVSPLELESRNQPEEPRELVVPIEIPQELQVVEPIESIIPPEISVESSSIVTSSPSPSSPLFSSSSPINTTPIIPLSPKPPIVVEMKHTLPSTTLESQKPTIPLESNESPEAIPPVTSVDVKVKKEESIEIPKEIEFSDIEPVSSTPFSIQTSSGVNPVFIKKDPVVVQTPTEKIQPVQTLEDIRNNLPESAIITTYSRAMMSSKNSTSSSVTHSSSFNKKKFILILFIVVLLSIIAGVIFAFQVGYIQLPSLVKKDSRSALLATASAYNNLTSYKSVTNVTVSFPLIANITNSLVSGDPTQSKDKDSVSFIIQTARNKDARSNLVDSRITVQSSLIKNDIFSQFISDPTGTYVTIPNLTSVIKKNTPPQSTISVKGEEWSALLSLFSNPYLDKIRNSRVFQDVINNKSNMFQNKIATPLSDLIKTAQIIQKPEEIIRGVETYHYVMTFDRQEVKKFLSTILDNSEIQLSEIEKNNLVEIFGSTAGTTLDIWVGKNTSLVYRYALHATIPLSKVINLEDKGISGNEVTLEWQTEFYDIHISNTITLPTESLSTLTYLNLVSDINLKNNLTELAPAMTSLRNAEGSYGKRTNPTGSCTNPNPSSAFSPINHSKGATNAVGNIADSMRTILNSTNGAGSCYSTQGAWAASFTRASDPQSSYCIDTGGIVKILEVPLNGTTCK